MPASARYKIHYVLFNLTYNNYGSNNIKPNKNKNLPCLIRSHIDHFKDNMR